MSQDYNKTVNLPQTDFPMRAALPKREPDMLKRWYEMDVYHKMVARNEGKPRFILHDGPPFSNGNIHMGTAMNKCLKDFIVRYKNMSGYQAPYVPGWDNHGIPIESAIIKQNKLDRKKMSIPEFRNACKEFAENFVNIQRDQFKRLGVLGEWDRPYLTMNPTFEAVEVRVFGKMYEKGYIYKGKKPVYWCPNDETALAEAEIEYADDPCTTVFVKFPVADDKGKLAQYCDLSKLFFVIWTTTTWTLPGNLAICVGPRIEYALVKVPSGEVYIVAKELAANVCKAAGIQDYEILVTLPGSELELMRARHPFAERDSLVLCGDHVTLDAGTGCVHTAPGFGADDYFICQKYDREKGTQLGVYVPVDDRGIMTDPQFGGNHINKANDVILPRLEADGYLLAKENIVHSYPHCWRCKKPVIFRATDQWFCSVDAFKDQAVAACDRVRWLPEWGHDRIVSMVRERADWCISRQRHWGLPIPVFYCSDCGKPVCTPETIESVAGIFAEKGSNAWFDLDAEALLPQGYTCPHCGGRHFTKETDTLDGWFDSGSTHIASLELDDPTAWPAAMYLEGADQYRGWFQSSLLTAVALKGRAPYDIVLTHGWTVDGEGKAMHKSLGNSVTPDELLPKYGADIIRLWASSADYRQDMRCSENIFKQLSDMYLKIRNTARYILGNIADFDPDQCVEFKDMLPIDQWALVRLNRLVERVLAGYESFEFHTVIHAVHRFCVVDMSNFYLDVLKDRLYCDGTDSFSRRSGQSAIYLVLDAMVRLIAPILAFTSDEIWQAMPHHNGADPGHIMYNDMPPVHPDWQFDAETEAKWDQVLRLRDEVNKALEAARNDKIIGKPLDAKVSLSFDPFAASVYEQVKDFPLETLCIVSQVETMQMEAAASPEGYTGTGIDGLDIKVEACEAPKCVRCWTRTTTVGSDPAHPELCGRCAKALQ